MTIDKEDRYMNACIKYLQKNMECVGYRDYIIERLNKYQKIEQIVNEYNLQLWDNTSDGAYNFQRIKEVIEDGDDN